MDEFSKPQATERIIPRWLWKFSFCLLAMLVVSHAVLALSDWNSFVRLTQLGVAKARERIDFFGFVLVFVTWLFLLHKQGGSEMKRLTLGVATACEAIVITGALLYLFALLFQAPVEELRREAQRADEAGAARKRAELECENAMAQKIRAESERDTAEMERKSALEEISRLSVVMEGLKRKTGEPASGLGRVVFSTPAQIVSNDPNAPIAYELVAWSPEVIAPFGLSIDCDAELAGGQIARPGARSSLDSPETNFVRPAKSYVFNDELSGIGPKNPVIVRIKAKGDFKIIGIRRYP